MGTQILVASAIYNLAGEIHKRPNVLKSTVINAILSQNNNNGIGSIIRKSYLNGTGITLKRFSNWAVTSGYSDALGVLESSFTPNTVSNSETILAAIPKQPNETLFLDHWTTAENDVVGSAVLFIKANYPTEINTAWTVEYLESTNTVRIYWVNNSFTDYTPTDFLPDTDYLFVYYSSLITNGSVSSTEIEYVTHTNISTFPSTSEWTLVTSSTEYNKEIALVTEQVSTKVYSDNRADEVTTTQADTLVNYDYVNELYEKKSYLGGTETALSNLTKNLELKNIGSITTNTSTVVNPPVNIGGGVSYVETIVTHTDSLTQVATHKITDIITNVLERTKGNLFIYEYGSGNLDLDALFGLKIPTNTLYPFIPIRINNQRVTATTSPVMYPKYKKAFRKATGSRDFEGFQDSFEESEAIGDMDYIYIAFGVSLNTLENVGKKYIYLFFKELLLMGATDLLKRDWINLTNTEQQSVTNYDAWWHGHALGDTSPMDLLTANAILRGSLTNNPRFILSMGTSDRTIMNFRMHIEWSGINETTGSGLAKHNAKVGELWVGNPPVTVPISGFSLIWQYEANAWRCITVSDLHHNNSVYKHKAVSTGFQEALDDTEESGFLIPLQKYILDKMSLVDCTQLTTSSTYAVINSYLIRKTKWYESGLFKVILVIVIIVIAVYTGYFNIGSAGLLGTHVAVGTAIGLSGLAAALVGFAVNALAAIVLSNIIKRVAVGLFGERLGAIIAAIANLAIGVYATTGGNFFTALTPSNLLNMTLATADAYSNVLEAETKDLFKESEQLLKDYDKKEEEIRNKYIEQFGISNQIVVGDFGIPYAYQRPQYESLDDFLNRTHLSGTDISEITLENVYKYVDIVLEADNYGYQ